MTPYQIHQTVNDFLSTGWTHTTIRTINEDSTVSIPFIEMYFKPGQVTGLEIMGASVRSGVFMINIFTKKGVGEDEGLVYGGKLEELFHHKIITNEYGILICENGFMLPYTESIGINKELQAYQHQTVIPFSLIAE